MCLKKTLLVLWLLVVFLTGSALAYSLGNAKAKIDFREEFRSESWWTFDKPGIDDSYTFFSSKMRLGLGLTSNLVDGYLQFHWTQFFNLPDDAGFGTGMLYYKNNLGPWSDPDTSVGYAAISQAWIRLKCPNVAGLSLLGGRFVYNSGLETMPKDPTLKWLRKLRISQRLIGGFEWSRVGRSFDGLKLVYDQPTWNLTIAGMHPTPGGFYLRRDDPDYKGYDVHDVDILTIALTLKDTYRPGLDAQVFYYYYNDERGLAPDPEIHNFGAHLLYTAPVGPGAFDFLVWGVYQWGTYGSLDHDAYGIAIEAGYKFKNVAWQPWFRVGYWYGSGDDDPTDNDHETFFMMIPTLRIYAFTPFYNLMNTNYFFGQVMFKPHPKVLVRSDVHYLMLTEDDDAWYLGSGITRPDKFGYVGKPSGGDDNLATMWDLSLFIKDLYNYNGLKLGLNLYYSHVWGDDVIENNFKDEDMDFFYAEMVITF